MFRVGAFSDIGPRKQSNQDSCCVLVSRYALNNSPDVYTDTALLAVCDGVGGLDSGEVASASVINWLTSWFERDYPKLINGYHADKEALFNAVQAAWDANFMLLNNDLAVHGSNKGARMGTTCTAILLFDGSFLIGHIGDTRVYRFRDGEMEILTNDQTWVAQEVERGNIPPEKARFHPKRNIILQSVGTQPDLDPEFSRGNYQLGDAYMVCCDGYRNELFDDELIGAFGSLEQADDSAVEAACTSLGRLVLERGERDNVTAVAAVYHEGTEYGAAKISVPPAFSALKAGE